MSNPIVASIFTQAIGPLTDLAVAGITGLCVVSGRWIMEHTKNIKVQGVLMRLDDAVWGAVREVAQTSADVLKDKAADGKLTAEDKLAVKKAAVDSVRNYLGPKGLIEVKKVLGVDDVAGVLNSKVEAAVHTLGQDSDRSGVENPQPVAVKTTVTTSHEDGVGGTKTTVTETKTP